MVENQTIINMSNNIHCFICLEDMNQPNYYCNNCKINVHYKCMRSYIKTRINNTQLTDKIQCSECRNEDINLTQFRYKTRKVTDLFYYLLIFLPYIVFILFLIFFLLILILMLISINIASKNYNYTIY